jgi:hypothetical protein
MKRAILVALGTGAIISSAAALGIGGASAPAVPASTIRNEYLAALEHSAAREAQRDRIETRYQAGRARCQAIGGQRRDQCLIENHAVRGNALLEAQAPYETRN